MEWYWIVGYCLVGFCMATTLLCFEADVGTLTVNDASLLFFVCALWPFSLMAGALVLLVYGVSKSAIVLSRKLRSLKENNHC